MAEAADGEHQGSGVERKKPQRMLPSSLEGTPYETVLLALLEGLRSAMAACPTALGRLLNAPSVVLPFKRLMRLTSHKRGHSACMADACRPPACCQCLPSGS